MMTSLGRAGSASPDAEGTHAEATEGSSHCRPRLLVVSYLAEAAFSPRGLRTRALLSGFRGDWETDLVAGKVTARGLVTRSNRARRVAGKLSTFVLLDKFEFWSRRHLRTLPAADAAYLIGFPFSPIAYAASSLARAGTPYVVDVGDPWALTADPPAVRGIARWRAQRTERRVWRHAAGAVLTTSQQARALAEHFPDLPILVRPNGTCVETSETEELGQRPGNGVLRIGHFGSIYRARLPLAPLLDALAQSGLWNGVELHQFGPDWSNVLSEVELARVVREELVPWEDVLKRAMRLDAALVVGNYDGKQLPSKTVDYLTLPIPRVAITQGGRRDALAEYVVDKPGWLVVAPDALDTPARLHAHLARGWTAEELAPPESEGWDAVACVVADFARLCLLASPMHVSTGRD